MAKVSLSRGLFACVDDVDLELVSAHRWHANPSNSAYGGWYAAAAIDGRTVYMHRLILGAGEGEFVDHADSDGLNNSRDNIRICTLSQNNMHRRAWTSHGLKSVYQNGHYIDGTPRWRVFLDTPGGRVEGGSFRCQQAAARRANELTAEHYGEFAVRNLAA